MGAPADSPRLPMPVPDDDSLPFWQGCREGKLLLQACARCGHVRYPPRPACPKCADLSVKWIEASGRGTVYSWIVAHHAVHPSVRDKIPYNVVLVELAEGPRMVSNLVGVPNDEIVGGEAVTVTFEQVTEDVSLPRFELAPSESG